MPERLSKYAGHFSPSISSINYYREIIKDDYLGLEERRHKQFIKLKRLLMYAEEKVPYYRNLFRKVNFSVNDFNNFSDLEAIPILTKECLQKNSEHFISDDMNKSNLFPNFTSGSTGTPLCIFFTPKELSYIAAIVKKQYNIAGVDLRDPYICIAKALNKKSLMLYQKDVLYINTLRFDTVSLDTIIDFLKKQRKFKFIRGYPTYLQILTRRIKECNVLMRPFKAVIAGYEYLSKENRELIEEVFQCKVFDYYAMTEGVIHGLECEYHTGLHLEMHDSFVEQIAVEQRTEGGKIIATGLNNYAMPLIRYDTGDVGVITEEGKCACGRTGPLLTKLYGRYSDLMQLNEGTTYNFEVLSRALCNVSGIRESRFVYYPRHKVVFEMVRNQLSLDRKKLYKHLSGLFSKQIAWEIREVSEIPRSENGKVNFISVVEN